MKDLLGKVIKKVAIFASVEKISDKILKQQIATVFYYMTAIIKKIFYLIDGREVLSYLKILKSLSKFFNRRI